MNELSLEEEKRPAPWGGFKVYRSIHADNTPPPAPRGKVAGGDLPLRAVGRRFVAVTAVLFLTFWSFAGRGQSVPWVTNQAEALAAAQKEGRLILLFAGRPSCAECQYMEFTVAESTAPPVSQLIQYAYVAWTCDIDQSTEWVPYANGLGSFALPMICIINPTNGSSYIDRTVGIVPANPLYARLLNRAPMPGTVPRIVGLGVTQDVVTLWADALPFNAPVTLERTDSLGPATSWVSVSNYVSLSRTNRFVDSGKSAGSVFYRIRSGQ